MYNTMSFNVGNDPYCILTGLIRKLESVGIRVDDMAVVHPRAIEIDNMTMDEKIQFAEETLLLDFKDFKAEKFGLRKADKI